MSAIYIHIPFCKRKCRYCDFYSSASTGNKQAVLAAMEREIETANIFSGKEELIKTVYFGGGTPSLLEADEIARLLGSLRSCYRVDKDAEITLEANPDDLNPEKLAAYRTVGINRLSVGIQSFDDRILERLGRRHSAGQAIRAVEEARTVGFENISVDLIYGIPDQDDRQWEKNVETALSMHPEHLSAYALSIEENTALDRWVRDGKYPLPDEEQAVRQYDILIGITKSNGLEHYEISNFCRPGFRSRHNGSYWTGKAYLGIGPSAHSFDGETVRRWNVSSNAAYIRLLNKGELWYESETLSAADIHNEYLMTRLRTSGGIVLSEYEKKFGDFEKLAGAVERFPGLMVSSGGRVRLTERGFFVSDGIISFLFRE